MYYFIAFIIISTVWRVIECSFHLKQRAHILFGKKYYPVVIISMILSIGIICYIDYTLLLNEIISAIISASFVYFLLPLRKYDERRKK